MYSRLLTVAALALACNEFAYAKDLKRKQIDEADFEVEDDSKSPAVPALDEDAQQEIKDLEMKKHEMMDKSLRYFDGLRGIWIGFNRGLYRETPRKDMEKECLNSAQRARW